MCGGLDLKKVCATRFSPHHPQVGQCKQRVQLGGALGEPAVAHLDVAELALDDPKGVVQTQRAFGLLVCR